MSSRPSAVKVAQRRQLKSRNRHVTEIPVFLAAKLPVSTYWDLTAHSRSIKQVQSSVQFCTEIRSLLTDTVLAPRLTVESGTLYDLPLMPVSQAGRTVLRDSHPFPRTQEYRQARRLVIPQAISLLGLRRFAVYGPGTTIGDD
jgi:hypothetical protein